MKKNIYYKEIYGHKNIVREIIYSLITALANYPSLIVYAVFRRNMGERFYSLASALGFAFFMLLPALPGLFGFGEYSPFNISDKFNWFWILFTFAFVGVAIFRRLEFSRHGHSFDTERFSYADGELWPFWEEMHETVPFLHLNDRMYVSKYYEPLVVLLAGLILLMFPYTGITGPFLILTAFLHFGRVHVQWQRGRNFILDRLDNIITNKEMAANFMDDNYKSPSGFNMNCPRPKDLNIRKQIIDQINDESAVTTE